MKHRLLYAEQIWRQQRWYVYILIALGIAVTIFLFASGQWHLNQSSIIWMSYVPAGLILAALLSYYRLRSYVLATDSGLVISRLFRSYRVEWDLVRSSRVLPLNNHFLDDRKKLVRPVNRALLDRPAVFVKLRDDPRTERLASQLGKQYADGDVLALSVEDADRLHLEITTRVPERTAANLGGQRRRKRKS